ncbi:MAG: CBS domain-containing protein [Phycisphaerales bacterium]|jgi:CBS domain-containing protein|nr:CBS domain-containing protein [Phycisphaerales bacterium]
MSTVSAILKDKGEGVVAIEPGASVLDAARRMNEHKIGCLVVTQNASVIGILTERDILTRLVAGEKDASRTRVADIMTKDVLCCAPDTPLLSLRGLMQRSRIRHVPVQEQGRLRGLVSIGDLNAFEADGLNVRIHVLEEYICRG